MARTLGAHTDPCDTLVVHADGAKRWTLCVPRAGAVDANDAEAAAAASAAAALSDADAAHLFELDIGRPGGCVAHADDFDALRRMRCEHMCPGASCTLPSPTPPAAPCT